MGDAILVSAGEVSGDRIGAPVVAELRRALGQVDLFGAGGPRLAAQGVEIRHSIDALAVTGVTEALRRSASAARLLMDFRRQILRRKPRLGLLIDYPGLNLRLAALLRRHGVPVLHYVAPQRWAWLPWRARALRGLVDRLAVTLPFEEGWFRRRGVPATFVGHPVLETFKPLSRVAALERLGLGAGTEVLALLPGSRDNEIRCLLPRMARSVRDLGAGDRAQPVIAVADEAASALCRALAPELPQGPAEAVLGAARAGLCASGTATLEAAVAGVPVVVCYRLSRVSHALARRLLRVPHVSLPNLIAGAPVLPELLQDEVTPPRMSHELTRLLDPQLARRTQRALASVVERLGDPGAARRVAELATELMR